MFRIIQLMRYLINADKTPLTSNINGAVNKEYDKGEKQLSVHSCAAQGAQAKKIPCRERQGNQKENMKKAGSDLLSRRCSIIGAGVLDFRVRNGNGYFHPAMATGIY